MLLLCGLPRRTATDCAAAPSACGALALGCARPCARLRAVWAVVRRRRALIKFEPVRVLWAAYLLRYLLFSSSASLRVDAQKRLANFGCRMPSWTKLVFITRSPRGFQCYRVYTSRLVVPLKHAHSPPTKMNLRWATCVVLALFAPTLEAKRFGPTEKDAASQATEMATDSVVKPVPRKPKETCSGLFCGWKKKK